jgi:hypothetical protein
MAHEWFYRTFFFASVLSRLKAAETKAKWLNACGVLPSCSPERAISSENMFR